MTLQSLLSRCCPAGAKYAVIDGNLHVAAVTAEDARLSYRCSVRHRLSQQSSSLSPPARIVLLNSKDSEAVEPLLRTPTASPGITQLYGQLGQESLFMWCNVPAATKIRYSEVFFL